VVAHIDIFPTVLSACKVRVPEDLKIDGRNFLPLIADGVTSWPDRHIVIQAHRGDEPVLYHNFAIRNQRWKLLHASGFGRENFSGKPAFELYDMVVDPLETIDLAGENPKVVEMMKKAYEEWFRDVSSTRNDNYAPPRIHIGTEYENPVVLTRQDWRHIKGRPWAEGSNGYWLLFSEKTANYDIHLRFHNERYSGEAILKVGDRNLSRPFTEKQDEVIFQSVGLKSGKLKLQGDVKINGITKGPWQVDVRRVD
jgi:arylsulfatase/arylsulfatase A